MAPDHPSSPASAPRGPGRRPFPSLTEHLAAVGYAAAYDLVVTGFAPYEALIEEVLGLVARTRPAATPPASTRVLDVACGTGTVAFRLAAAGYRVTGVDPVARLVEAARRGRGARGPGCLSLHHLDLARTQVPGRSGFDAVVSMHTLTWHPDPPALLDGCRRALRPGGYGIVLAYARPPHVVDTVRELCGQDGPAAAGRALRWLVPTAIFEALRHGPRRYLGRDDLARTLTHAGFHILELRSTFLAGLSLLAWVRRT